MRDLNCYAIQMFYRRDPGSRLVSAGVSWETLGISDLVFYGYTSGIMQLKVHGDLVSVWYTTTSKADFLFGSPEGAKAFEENINLLMGEDLISTGES